MGNNIFTGNIFIEILVRFEGNSFLLFCQDLLKRIIDIEASWIYCTELNVLNKLSG